MTVLKLAVPTGPTRYLPGTPAKVLVMAARARAGLPVFDPEDSQPSPWDVLEGFIDRLGNPVITGSAHEGHERAAKREKQREKSSPWPGVHRYGDKWRVQRWINGRQEWIGVFDLETEAYAAYMLASVAPLEYARRQSA